MRRWLVVVLCVCACKGASQGLVVFNNRVGEQIVAPIYDVDPYNPAFSQYGTGLIYNGGPLAGTAFTAQLFGGPTNLPLERLTTLEPSTFFRTNDAAGFVVAPNRAVAVPGVPEGERAKVQLRAWNNRGGTVTNWNQVLTDPTIGRGASLPIITPPLGSLFIVPPNLIGLQSFNLVLPIKLSSLKRGSDGRFRFNYINPTSRTYCVEASSDLSQWTPAGNIGTGNGTYTDPASANQSHRFYRVVPCP